jgi:hypothetical protein
MTLPLSFSSGLPIDHGYLSEDALVARELRDIAVDTRRRVLAKAAWANSTLLDQALAHELRRHFPTHFYG